MSNFEEEYVPKWEFANRRIRKSSLKDGSKRDYDPSAKTKYHNKKQLDRLGGHIYRKINKLDRFGRDATKKYDESHVPKERFVNRRHRNAEIDGNKAKADYHHGARFERIVNSPRYKKNIDKMFNALRKDAKRTADRKTFRSRQLSKADAARRAAGGLKKESIQMNSFREFLSESKLGNRPRGKAKDLYFNRRQRKSDLQTGEGAKSAHYASDSKKRYSRGQIKESKPKNLDPDIAKYRTNVAQDKFDRKYKPGAKVNLRRKLKHLDNVMNKNSPGTRFMMDQPSKSQTNKRYTIDTAAKKAARAKRKIGIKESSTDKYSQIRAKLNSQKRPKGSPGWDAIDRERYNKTSFAKNKMKSDIKKAKTSDNPFSMVSAKSHAWPKNLRRGYVKKPVKESTDIGSVSRIRKVLGVKGRQASAVKTISKKLSRNKKANDMYDKHGSNIPKDKRRSSRFKRLRSGVNESSPAWAKRLKNADHDYRGINKDIDKARPHARKSTKLDKAYGKTITKTRPEGDKRKLKASTNHMNKNTPGIRYMPKPQGSALSSSVRKLRKKDK